MKTFIQRFFNLLKSLFLKLSLIVTLQIGKEEVNRDKHVSEDEEPHKEDAL